MNSQDKNLIDRLESDDLLTIGTVNEAAERIRFYGAKADRLNAALAPVEAMTLLPNARGGHSVTIDFPDHDQAARAYALLMQALDA